MREGLAVRHATPAGFRVLIALTLPLVAAMTVVGTYLGQEIVVFAGLLSLSVVGFLFIWPMIGVALMTFGFMVAAYPTALQALGVLSVINLMGVCLLLLLLANILGERDLTIALPRPVIILLVIGVIFLLVTFYAEVKFPELQVSRGTGRTGYKLIDRTGEMSEQFVTRLAFVVFVAAFIRRRLDVRTIFYCFTIALFMAVPSALANWGEGTLAHGFRVRASITTGSNSNRLGMICCMEILCWWYWFRASPTVVRRLWAYAAIGASVLVMSGTGSRSALIGGAATTLALLIGPPRYRISVGGALAAVALFCGVLLTAAPPEAVQRMFSFFPQSQHVLGASSIELREETIDTAKEMFRDHPLTGVGLGNFREVARQVYADQFFRPPHNSFLWAAAEGGVFVVLAYGVLFWFAWRDYSAGTALVAYDEETAALGMAMQRVFFLFLVFSALADLWLTPFMYVLVSFAYVFRRYMEGCARVAAAERVVLPLEEAA
jgi:O-antigen ligase